MIRDVYVARAAALQAAAAIRKGGHFFCDQLPSMDVERFLAALAEETDDAAGASLALVGYGTSETDLRYRFDALGLAVGHVTTDLHVAARWRNEPEIHAQIIAFARGRHPGVSTLAHFPRGDTREFARGLLRWARTEQAALASTPPQRTLLQVLEESPDLGPLVSLSGVAEFLAAWREARGDDDLSAPRRALPRLGILPDRALLGDSKEIAGRLLANFKLTQDVARMTGSRLDDVRKRVKRGSPEQRSRGLDVLERADTIRRNGDFDAYSRLDYQEACEVFRPTSRASRPTPAPDDPDDSQRTSVRDGRAVTTDGGKLLIDGENSALEALAGRIQEALTAAVEGEDDSASGQYEVNGDEQPFEFDVEREVLTWVRFFCSNDTWGGVVESPSASFEDALRDHRQCDPTRFEPLGRSIPHDGRLYDLRSLLAEMQRELAARGVTTEDLCGRWDRMAAARRAVLAHLDILLHQPMLALAGRSDLRAAVAELLQACDRFYAKLAQHHSAMHEIDHAWTQLLFEAVAALDVVQIRTTLKGGRTSWKAVLLPVHPLHLWRYERIAALARGLRPDGMDRDAVLDQLQKPEHYLGVIQLTSLPAGRGGNQALPVARDYHGLAVFENLRNAYSGDDGVEVLQHCVRQFAQIYVNHVRPLRLALVNPPNASRTLVTLLSRGRGRPAPRFPLLVDVYATPDHEARLQGARRFSTEDRDQIEEHIAAGRLRLRVNDETLPLADRLRTLQDRPVHVVAVFDEATTAMRHQPGGSVSLLPMSPFAIRRRITFQGIHRKVELLPSHETTVFRSFYDMVAKLRNARAGQTPQASADAERMAGHIDRVLADAAPGAFWFFFADRALPTPGRVGVARILERHDGRRRTVCYDASFERLALLLRRPLDDFNLRFSLTEVQELLDEGVALLGDGLLNLFRADAQPDPGRVRGFAGMLVAARDYRDRHPGALVVSVDTKLARLWLRLADADSAERCDLLALRRDDGVDGVVTVDAIEVKTVGGSAHVPGTDIQKATEQLLATLTAIRQGLEEEGEDASPLAAPRQEMLKEVFVSGCQSATASPEDRTRWAEWLQVLFREQESADATRLCGTVYAVELSSNTPSSREVLHREPYEIVVRRLREERIQTLISPRSASSRPEAADGDEGEQPPPRQASAAPRAEPVPPSPADAAATPSAAAPPGEPVRVPGSKGAAAQEDVGIRFVVGESVGAGDPRPYHLHPSNTRLNQLNIGVVGDLGTGKTQLTKALIHRFTQQAARNRGHAPKFLIFDYKRDYTKSDFVRAVDARVVSPHRIPLNVFDLPSARGHLPAARLGRVKFLNDVLQKIYGGIGPRQRNHLKTAVMRAYDAGSGAAPTLTDVVRTYADVVGDRVDAPYSILSDLDDLEVFVDRAADAQPFDEFFSGVTVIDLAALGIGDKERNMLLVLFLNLYYEYMINLDKQPYVGTDPQLRFIDSMLLVDEADNVMKYNFDVLRQVLLQGREFGVGVLLASQYLSHFRTRETDYSEPLLTWFIHKVPNVSSRDLQSIGLNRVAASTVEAVKTLDVHHCFYKTLDVPGRFMRAAPFHEILAEARS